MIPEQDDLLALLRSRLQTLERVVARYQHLDALDLSDAERTRVALAIESIEAGLDQLW
jgi:hypothetical protein